MSVKRIWLYPHRTNDPVLESENDPHDPKNWRRSDSVLVLIKESFLDRKDPESVSPQNGWVSVYFTAGGHYLPQDLLLWRHMSASASCRDKLFSTPHPTIPSSAQGVFLDVCKGRLLRTSRPFSVFKKIIIYPPPTQKKPPRKKIYLSDVFQDVLLVMYKTVSRRGVHRVYPKIFQEGKNCPFPKFYFW